MYPVYCLTRVAADLPPQTSWLTTAERTVLEDFRFAKRRNDWLLGRWTAKQASARYLGLSGDGIGRLEILAAADGAPQISLDGEPASVIVSISHSADTALCAVANNAVTIGCDIEQVATRDRAFAETFLTGRERDWADAAPDALQALAVTLIWSAKESVLKVTRDGLRADTWSVDIDNPDSLTRPDWQPLHARHADGRREFFGWWRCEDRFVLTLAADRDVQFPVSLGHRPKRGLPGGWRTGDRRPRL